MLTVSMWLPSMILVTKSPGCWRPILRFVRRSCGDCIAQESRLRLPELALLCGNGFLGWKLKIYLVPLSRATGENIRCCASTSA